MGQYDITPREALAIQERQVKHYAHLYPGGEEALRTKMASMTRVDDLDLDKEYDIFTINERVPRGGDIEHLCGVDFGGA